MTTNYTDGEAARCIAVLSLPTPFTRDDLALARRTAARDWHPDHFQAGGGEALQNAQERMSAINAACDYLDAHFERASRLGARAQTAPKSDAETRRAAQAEAAYAGDPDFAAYKQEWEAAHRHLTDAQRAPLWEIRVRRWPEEKIVRQAQKKAQERTLAERERRQAESRRLAEQEQERLAEQARLRELEAEADARTQAGRPATYAETAAAYDAIFRAETDLAQRADVLREWETHLLRWEADLQAREEMLTRRGG